MITVSFTTFIMIALGLSLGVLFILWLKAVSPRSSKEEPMDIEDYLVICSFCAHEYIHSKKQTITTCPLCGSLVKR